MKQALSIAACVLVWSLSLSVAAEPAGPAFRGQVYLKGGGTPVSGARVTFFDLGDLRQAFSGVTDEEGRFVIAGPRATAMEGVLPTGPRLLQNYPNPFNPSTLIPYELAEAGSVRLEVYNMLGQRIRTLVDGVEAAGLHTVSWKGLDDQGHAQAAGIYLYRLTAAGVSSTREMVLVDGAVPLGGSGGTGSGARPSGAEQQEAVRLLSGMYGVTIAGAGIETYVQADVQVGAGAAPLSFEVEAWDAAVRQKPAVEGARILGDVNNDGVANISDALIVATYGLDPSITMPNSGDITLGDVNGDGRTNISDALMIATYGVDPENTFLLAGIGEPVGGGPAELTVELPGGATMEFVWIEPGTFEMGSSEWDLERSDGECPQHRVTIRRGFWLGKYEVTQGQWESVMGTTPWTRTGYYYKQLDPDNPAVYVSWNDVAGAYGLIARLNAALRDNVYRLPTEAEWEYACRAGTDTRWSFGDDDSELGDYAWFHDNAWEVGEQYGHAVGTKLPNPWGLYDMHGNVSEWCQDRHGPYTSESQTDPQGPRTGSYRVIRGGGFEHYARSTRSAYRDSLSPRSYKYYIGARLLRTP